MYRLANDTSALLDWSQKGQLYVHELLALPEVCDLEESAGLA